MHFVPSWEIRTMDADKTAPHPRISSQDVLSPYSG